MIVYVAVAVWGFAIGSGESILSIVPVNTEDNVLHLLIGLAGWPPRPQAPRRRPPRAGRHERRDGNEEATMANGLITLVKGFSGKPSHPPLTDAAIGAYTVGVVMLVLGAFGVEEEQTAHGALLAIGGGLALTLPTALTGLLDWLDIEKGTPRRTIATLHLVTMVLATALFAVTFLTHLDGYDDGTVDGYVALLGVLAEGLLIGGGYLGGALVFVYGIRVLGRREASAGDALIPGRAAQAEDPSPPFGRPPLGPGR